jgi:hypothetical protein
MPYVSERLLLTLWVGALWAIGYLAVPMAFATLGDISVAGDYAGRLFKTVNMLGLGAGSALLISYIVQLKTKVVRNWRLWILVSMLTLTAVFLFYLQPAVAEAKQQAAQTSQFAYLHNISEWTYHLLSLLGLSLVVSQHKLSGNHHGEK